MPKAALADFAIGDRVGNWTVIGPSERVIAYGVTSPAQLCECDCGTRRIMVRAVLHSGTSLSCGCRRGRRISANRAEHGDARTDAHGGIKRLYSVWAAMKARCSNPAVKNFARYGGRGITVCSAWQSSYTAFREWAMLNGYHAGLSLDRIDCDGGYGPDNCRWADIKTQANNTSTNHFLEALGERKTIAEWAADTRCTVGVDTFENRIFRGWSVESALTAARFSRPNGTKPYRKRQRVECAHSVTASRS